MNPPRTDRISQRIIGSVALTLLALVFVNVTPLQLHAQDAFKCGTGDFREPTKPTQSSTPAIVTQSTSCESTDPTVLFDPTVPANQQDEIRQDVSKAIQFFCGQLPYRVGQVTIFAFASIDAYANRYGMSLSDAQKKWSSNTAEGGYNSIDIYTRSQGWQQSQPFDSHLKIITHELFHVIQSKLSNANKKPTPLPLWLIEGAAEYLGFRGIDAAGSYSFVIARDLQAHGAWSVTTPLSTSGYATAGNIYSFWFSAADYLVGSRPSWRLASLWDTSNGKTGEGNFQSVFGITIDNYYPQFEDYRSHSLVSPFTFPLGITFEGTFPPGTALSQNFPSDKVPYVFRITGYDWTQVPPDQFNSILKRPQNVGWGGTNLGPEFLVLYIDPAFTSGSYTVALDLPDGRHTETNFGHVATSGSGVTNPKPSIASLMPSQAKVGDPGFVLIVTGSNFVNGAIVQWNGSNRLTRMRSATQLKATLTGGLDFVAPGNVTVTVVNPPPSGGSSTSSSFTVTNADPLPTLPPAPILITETNSTRAIALDSVTMLRDPFPLSTTLNFSADKRTRIMFFAINVSLMPGEDSSVVTCEAENSQRQVFTVPVEYVGNVPNLNSVSQINVRPPAGLTGDVLIAIAVRGVVSNQALVTIR